VIRGATRMDPCDGSVRCGDLAVRDGRIVAQAPAGAGVIDAVGRVLAPGLIDLHVHLREGPPTAPPAAEPAETIETGTLAAARGGFPGVVAMPNTAPPIDTPEAVRWLAQRGRDAGHARVWPSACLTRGRAGRALADLADLADAGAVAFTDDGSTVSDECLMEAAMRAARAAGRPVMDHALDPALAGDGVMHAGSAAARCGLPGIPPEAESRIVERDIRLCAATGCAVHIQHVSAAASVALIREARRRGLPVSGEATPHHLALTDEDVPPGNANWKMNPPLRGAADRDAILEGVADGTLGALATDHAPHHASAKARGFRAAPFGIVGLETAVGVTFRALVQSGRMSVMEWLRRWTSGPAAILGIEPPSLAPGRPADLVLLDLEHDWDVQPAEFLSRARNTPFDGARCRGRAVCTLLAGRIAWRAPKC
jgi:dihydroorotase